MQDVVNIITTVGFPIAAFLLVWWDGRKREDRLNQENNGREDRLLLALQESTKAQAENAAALSRLADAINAREV